MNQFEVKLNQENLEKPILNEWDRKILLEGSKNVVDRILKEFRGKLPDGIIYPETSARPLAYLFDPIFTKISKEQNRKKPSVFFLKVNRTDTHTKVFEDSKGRELTYDETMQELKKMYDSMDSSYALKNHMMNLSTRLVENTHANRFTAEERALEIEKYNEELSGKGMIANVAVIDDFTNQGTTATEINYAFGYDVPYFAIFGTTRENPVSEENMGVVIDTDDYPENITSGSNTKLSYTKAALAQAVGINKTENINSKYVDVNKNQTVEDRRMMDTLRKEMKQLGEQIAEQF